MESQAIKNSLLPWILLATLSVVWGTSFVLIKRGLVSFSPVQVASLRIVITAICFLPVMVLKSSSWNFSKLRYLAAVGFFGSFLPAILFSFAQTKISSSLAGILNSLSPLFTLLLGIFFFKVESTITKIIGVLVGLSGAIYLLFASQGLHNLQGIQFGFLVLIACFFYGISNNVVKSHLQDASVIMISALAYFIAGIPSAVILLSTDFFQIFKTDPNALEAFAYVFLLAFIGTFICSVLFFKLIKSTSALFASMVSYFIPVVALFWGILDGETISIVHFGGMAMILAGVYITRK